ncbi:MAG: S8 family serine peptidase [bacterium]|nr:S8 family serine peptidase [bacterium]
MATSKKTGYLQPGIKAPPASAAPDYVIVELLHTSRIAVSESGFTGTAESEQQARSLNGVLEAFNVKDCSSLFGLGARAIRKRVSAAPASLKASVTAGFAHAGFARLIPRRRKDLEDLVQRLNRRKSVWKAVAAPRPVPAVLPANGDPGSRNFEPSQGYLHSAPNGIGAMGVWGLKGGRGRGVRICDIEGNWNLKHEDLATNIPLFGGTPINDLGWRNHGTAVLGEMISKPSKIGCVGISHRARGAVQSAMVGGVFNAAAAIMNAASRLRAGDVILIELHAPGPRGPYVAMQYWDDIFSAIRAVTAKGITVVEAAGNGGEDFGRSAYAGSGLQKDSGAIVVGAGIPPTNYYDFDTRGTSFRHKRTGNPRSRIWFSNYGRIVNVQAWGWHVTTLGYGDAQGGAENRWYTLRFSGTSSASPIVTGAVACIQGRARAKNAAPLSPAEVRQLLVSTGTPQTAGPGVPLTQHIGPQPDLERAFAGI